MLCVVFLFDWQFLSLFTGHTMKEQANNFLNLILFIYSFFNMPPSFVLLISLILLPSVLFFLSVISSHKAVFHNHLSPFPLPSRPHPQITNQMIRACQVYISHQGTETIWSQPRSDVRGKIQHCLKLHATYRTAYQKTKVRGEEEFVKRKHCEVKMRVESTLFHGIRLFFPSFTSFM